MEPEEEIVRDIMELMNVYIYIYIYIANEWIT